MNTVSSLNPYLESSWGFSLNAPSKASKAAFQGKIKINNGLSTSGTFAEDIVRRLKSSPEQVAKEFSPLAKTLEQPANLAAGKEKPAEIQNPQATPKTTDALKNSLQDTIDYVAKNYGGKAATAIMGIVYQQVGDSNVTEETLGNAFLEGIKVIDRNFGVAEGDKLIGEINRGLNKELNSYFDNGRNEEFFDAAQYDVSRAIKGATEAINNVFSNLFAAAEEGDDAGSPLPDTLTEAAQKLRKQSERIMLKKMLANGEVPPAYLQDALSSLSPAEQNGLTINTSA